MTNDKTCTLHRPGITKCFSVVLILCQKLQNNWRSPSLPITISISSIHIHEMILPSFANKLSLFRQEKCMQPDGSH